MTRVALLGADDAAADAVRDAGGTPVGADLDSADVAAVFTEAALLDAARAHTDTPLFPVGAGPEYGGAAKSDRERALAALATGDYRVADRPTLAVRTDDTVVRALADATLVTRDPAKISEYAVETPAREIATVRADGVVAATPTGSRGYAADAGGPVLDASLDGVAVVPIAPFAVDRSNWVAAPPLTVTVVRDETDVELYVDGRQVAPVPPEQPVELARGDPLRVAVAPASRRPQPRD
jgi:NAD+ kinase